MAYCRLSASTVLNKASLHIYRRSIAEQDSVRGNRHPDLTWRRRLYTRTVPFDREKADENSGADVGAETGRSNLHQARCAGARRPQTTRGQGRRRGARHGWSTTGGDSLGAGLREEDRAERQVLSRYARERDHVT